MAQTHGRRVSNDSTTVRQRGIGERGLGCTLYAQGVRPHPTFAHTSAVPPSCKLSCSTGNRAARFIVRATDSVRRRLRSTKQCSASLAEMAWVNRQTSRACCLHTQRVFITLTAGRPLRPPARRMPASPVPTPGPAGAPRLRAEHGDLRSSQKQATSRKMRVPQKAVR